jgi:hypothetical protein
MLKEARKQSGSTWNERKCIVEGSSSMWGNLEIVSLQHYLIVLFNALGYICDQQFCFHVLSFLKIKKFQSNKASFPLFDSLGELYDGKFYHNT